MKKLDHTRLVAGAGKANVTLHWITEYPLIVASTDKIRDISGTVYVTSRDEVESLDTERFLANFGPHIEKDELQDLRCSVHFTIDGFDDTEEEIYEIPEVRRYYAHLHKVFPCWLYHGHLASFCLRTVMFSVLSNVKILRRKKQVCVETSKKDVHKFFMESLPTAALLHARTGISKQSGAYQLEVAARYLGLPDK